MMRFVKDDRKIEKMRPYIAAQARTGRSGVAAIGVAQEYANVFTGTKRDGSNGVPWFSLTKVDRRVSCYYFYLWDDDFGPGFIKICATSPTPPRSGSTGMRTLMVNSVRAGWTAPKCGPDMTPLRA